MEIILFHVYMNFQVRTVLCAAETYITYFGC